MPKPKDDGQTYYEMPKTTKPKKKVKCSNCRLVGHTKSGCYKYWQDKNERELKYRNFDDDEVCGRRKESR